MTSTLISPYIYSCDCPGGSSYDSGQNLCIFATGCDSGCKDICIRQNDNTACVGDCADNSVLTKTSLGSNIYSCVCPAGTTYNAGTHTCNNIISGPCSNNDQKYITGINTCLYYKNCHPLCGELCITPNDWHNCYLKCSSFAVKSSENFLSGLSLFAITCTCPENAEFSSIIGRCMINSSEKCHQFCASHSCASSENPEECIGFCSNDSVTNINSLYPSLTNCTCPRDMQFESQKKKNCYFNKNCHSLCGSLCSVQNDNTKCLESCVEGAVISGKSNIVSCSCPSDAVYINGKCLYEKRWCHALCGEYCLEKNISTKCYQNCAAFGINVTNPYSDNQFAVSCQCPESMAFIDNSCYYTGIDCHPYCKKVCFEKNDSSQCYKGCSEYTIWTETTTKNKWRCDCPCPQNSSTSQADNSGNNNNSAPLSQNSTSITCLPCSNDSIEGRQQSEENDAQSQTETESAMNLGGVTAVSVMSVMSVFLSGNISKYIQLIVPNLICINTCFSFSNSLPIDQIGVLLGLGQTASMILLINMPVIPANLIVFSKGMQFISFEFIPNIIVKVFGESNSEENELHSNVKYHPSNSFEGLIQSNMFRCWRASIFGQCREHIDVANSFPFVLLVYCYFKCNKPKSKKF